MIIMGDGNELKAKKSRRQKKKQKTKGVLERKGWKGEDREGSGGGGSETQRRVDIWKKRHIRKDGKS